MRGARPNGPVRFDLGPGSEAARALLATWETVDWFSPARDEDEATRAFAAHQALDHRSAPELLPPPCAARLVRGDWAAFAALVGRARASRYDWKFGGLKPLARRHSSKRGWSRAAAAPDRTSTGPRPDDALFRVGDVALWTTFGPALPLDEALPKAMAEGADWYLAFAHGDLVDAIEWQLARADDDLGENPFAPLVAVYAAGGLPFVLGPEEAVLFVFSPAS